MHFCQQHILHPELKIDKVPIPVVAECKFLGLILDRKLNFISHLKYLKERCMKAMNLLKVVAHKDWGADCATLVKLYRSHIRSKLDYGCIVYCMDQRESLTCKHWIECKMLPSASV
jgi:hypothetical protein